MESHLVEALKVQEVARILNLKIRAWYQYYYKYSHWAKWGLWYWFNEKMVKGTRKQYDCEFKVIAGGSRFGGLAGAKYYPCFGAINGRLRWSQDLCPNCRPKGEGFSSKNA